MLDMNKWTKLVKPFDEQSPQVFVTTLQFGEYKTELANVEALAIRFNKSGNEEYGNFFYSIHFGAYVQSSEMLNVVAYMPITKDVYNLVSENLDKLWNKELLQLIKDKFNLDLSCFNFSVHSKRINFELLNKKQNHHFDFFELAELVFKQLGLFE
jgi:hypothetical protein